MIISNSTSEAVQLAAVSKNGCAIKYINNPSEAIQLASINNYYKVSILDDKKQIVEVGCQIHTYTEWKDFSLKEIENMDGKNALKFYPILIERLTDYFEQKDE